MDVKRCTRHPTGAGIGNRAMDGRPRGPVHDHSIAFVQVPASHQPGLGSGHLIVERIPDLRLRARKFQMRTSSSTPSKWPLGVPDVESNVPRLAG